MAGRRGRIRAGCIAIGALVLVVAMSACNPIVNETTTGYAGIPPYIPASSGSRAIDFTGTESGWLEVQVTDSVNPAVSVSGLARYDASNCDQLAPTWAWSGGTSLGFQRLGHIDPGARVFVTAAGSSDPIRFNLRVVNDAGEPVGDLAPHLTPPGQFEDVGCAIG